MGKMFRSIEMCKLQLIIQSDAVYESVGELGELGAIMFADLNPGVNAFQRNFVKEIRLAEEMERKVRFFAQQLTEARMVEDINDYVSKDSAPKFALPTENEIPELDQKLTELENEVRQMNQNETDLQKNFLELTELRHIVKEAAAFFMEAQERSFEEPRSNTSLTPQYADESQVPTRGGVKLGFVTGVLDRDRFATFERVLWRACRGNVFLRRADIEEELKDPTTNAPVHKVAFIVFFQGDVLASKVKRICDGFGATLYPCPENASERRALMERVDQSLSELQMVLSRTNQFRLKVLKDILDQYESWAVKVKKIKAVYHTMNTFNFDVTNAALIGEGWCPTERLNEVHHALTRVTERTGSGVPTIIKRVKTSEQPPTQQHINKFTKAFQTIVDAYGVATYEEVNPGLYTLISFPFLFAVMFGDIGHGFLMAAFAGWMLINEKTLLKTAPKYGEIFLTIFQGRYIIFLMGVFSIYTGAIYNDCFSKMLWVFDTKWALPQDVPFNGTITLNPHKIVMGAAGTPCEKGCGFKGDGPYPFGIDPVWGLSDNKLNFMNSLKMKSSILIGVIHMCFGICLQVYNHLHFKRNYSVYMEFIPQILFMTSIFGYLCILILAKWMTVWGDNCALPGDITTYSCDPSILILLINMFLSPGKLTYADHTVFFSNRTMQSTLQVALLAIALVCVPWMLLTKPFYLKNKYEKIQKNAQASVDSGEGHVIDHEEGGHGGHGEEFEFGEIMVHQAIHTIEFVLGCVSNTASYLRLWALSLAHAQLSEVLWDMILHAGFAAPVKGVMLFCTFAAWATLTVAVLLLMEGMSAFLHALRLHWVEFNNKFYQGTGYQFVPFHFRKFMVEAAA